MNVVILTSTFYSALILCALKSLLHQAIQSIDAAAGYHDLRKAPKH